MTDRSFEKTITEELKKEIIEIHDLYLQCKMYGYFNYKNLIKSDFDYFEFYEVDQDLKEFFTYCCFNDMKIGKMKKILEEVEGEKKVYPSNIH